MSKVSQLSLSPDTPALEPTQPLPRFRTPSLHRTSHGPHANFKCAHRYPRVMSFFSNSTATRNTSPTPSHDTTGLSPSHHAILSSPNVLCKIFPQLGLSHSLSCSSVPLQYPTRLSKERPLPNNKPSSIHCVHPESPRRAGYPRLPTFKACNS